MNELLGFALLNPTYQLFFYMTKTFSPKRLRSYDKNSVIKEIQRVITEHFNKIPPPKIEFEKYSKVKGWFLKKMFGSYANAMNEAGFNYAGTNYENIILTREKFTKEKMIEDLSKIKGLNNGNYFTAGFYKKHGGVYAIKTLKKHFDASWEKLLYLLLQLKKSKNKPVIVIKEPYKRPPDYSEEQVLSEIKRVWDKLGYTPTYNEFGRESKISTGVVARRFGNWVKAIDVFCQKKGYSIKRRNGSFTHSNEGILLNELTEIKRKITSDILTYKKYRALGGSYSIGTFQNQFGSWKKAINMIGLNDGHSGKYSNEELFNEMQRVWEGLGEQPSYKEMSKRGNISGQAYQNRFGSWTNAIYAFCEDRSNLNDNQDSEYDNDATINKGFLLDSNRVLSDKEDISHQKIERKVIDVIEKTTYRNISPKLRFMVLQKDNFTCQSCGRTRKEDGVKLEVDHKIPYSKEGGETVLDNLQILCRECNRGKSNMH